MSSGNGTEAPCPPILYAYEPESFTFSFIYSFLVYYCIFTIMELVLTHFFKPFRKMPKLQQRNFLVYLNELVITTLLLPPWLVFGVYLFEGPDPPDESTRRGIVLIAVFLVNLYLYEIAFKISTPKSLLLHHVATMLLVILAVYRYQYNGKIVSIRGVFTLGLTALTEQTTFFGLILYRAKKEWSLWPLLFASVFTLVSKTGLLAWTVQIVADGDDPFWYYTFGPTAGLLFISQIYGAYVLVAIWRKARRDLQKERLKKLNGETSEVDLNIDSDEENGGSRKERRKSTIVVMTEKMMSLGQMKKRKERQEESSEELHEIESNGNGNGMAETRPRSDSAVARIVNVVRERGASIADQVASQVRIDDEHVEDVV